MALTALAISKLKPKEKLYFVADGGGLCLAISPTGGKSWHWRYRYNSKAQIIGLGKYPEVSLEQARRKRDDMLYSAVYARSIPRLTCATYYLLQRKSTSPASTPRNFPSFCAICSLIMVICSRNRPWSYLH